MSAHGDEARRRERIAFLVYCLVFGSIAVFFLDVSQTAFCGWTDKVFWADVNWGLLLSFIFVFGWWIGTGNFTPYNTLKKKKGGTKSQLISWSHAYSLDPDLCRQKGDNVFRCPAVVWINPSHIVMIRPIRKADLVIKNHSEMRDQLKKYWVLVTTDENYFIEFSDLCHEITGSIFSVSKTSSMECNGRLSEYIDIEGLKLMALESPVDSRNDF